MSDKITSIQHNQDGGFTFGFIFDAGNGLTGVTQVVLPAPAVNEDGIATPYTIASAKVAVLPIAAAQKAQWLSQMGEIDAIGDVGL